jgi:predicted permease
VLTFILKEFAFAVRSLIGAGKFTRVAVLTATVGIAANVIVFSVVNAVLLKPLPYSHPEQLMTLAWFNSSGSVSSDITAEAFFGLQEHRGPFENIAAVYAVDLGVNFLVSGSPRYISCLKVSSTFFETLGVPLALGRGFTADEDKPGAANVVVLSHSAWEQDMNLDAGAVGREVLINGVPHKVVGVMPAGFQSEPEAALWLPLRLTPANADPGNEYGVIARLKEGVKPRSVQSSLDVLTGFADNHPLRSTERKVKLVALPWRSSMVSGVRRNLLRLFIAVLMLMLITAINLALLFVARVEATSQERAVRVALGSSRARLVWMCMLESLLIVIPAAVFGVIAGKEILPLVLLLIPSSLPLKGAIHIDGNVLCFACLISVFTALLAGLLPSFKVARVNVQELLSQSARALTTSPQRSLAAKALVVAQTALTLALLPGAIGLGENFFKLQRISPGFDTERLLVLQLSLASDRYASSASTSGWLEMVSSRIRRFAAKPDVACAIGLPFDRGLNLILQKKATGLRTAYGQYRIVSPTYFQTLGVPLVGGRSFSDSDNAEGTRVAIINETLAHLWWPNEDPIGQSVGLQENLSKDFAEGPRRVVGIVGDIRESGLDQPPPPTVYVPLRQTSDSMMAFVNRLFPTSIVMRAKTQSDYEPQLRGILQSADPGLAVVSLLPLKEMVSRSLARPRFYVLLASIFAALALLLNLVGLYGLLSYQVMLRMREFAVRMALGERRSTVLKTVIKQSLKLVGLGTALGIGITLFLGKTTISVRYNEAPNLGAVVGAALLMEVAAGITGLLIATRAAAIELTQVLKAE